ncbi:MAG: GNAT family N-acetyltransferase [Actinobacteria bacterium]|nr:MAG: GNAT family N-acetyltransferase [Actinomycetota bacterium]
MVEDGPNGGLGGMASGFYDAGTNVAYLAGMFVEPAYRGAGVGRRLVEGVEAWARELGAMRMELEVNPELNAAVRLYECCGYERTGRSRVVPPQPSATAIEMSKTLADR